VATPHEPRRQHPPVQPADEFGGLQSHRLLALVPTYSPGNSDRVAGRRLAALAPLTRQEPDAVRTPRPDGPFSGALDVDPAFLEGAGLEVLVPDEDVEGPEVRPVKPGDVKEAHHDVAGGRLVDWEPVL
jgi:hypothetical protein